MIAGMRVVALIPARSGSRRVKDKNIRQLAGHPLLAYTVCAARDSGVFDAVVCATDSEEYAKVARYYGAEVPALRPAEISGERSADIEWVAWILDLLTAQARSFDAFSILRPTSPFRLPSTIQRAWKAFAAEPACDSLRAVARCTEHPGKMWVIRGRHMLPFLPLANGATPWHSSQLTVLPEIYVQDASLEFAWTRVARNGQIAGEFVVPFVSEGLEGFDINRPEDWILAEHYIRTGEARLAQIAGLAYGSTS
jgi:N-acylneuraminate cytidylyltransferase